MRIWFGFVGNSFSDKIPLNLKVYELKKTSYLPYREPIHQCSNVTVINTAVKRGSHNAWNSNWCAATEMSLGTCGQVFV